MCWIAFSPVNWLELLGIGGHRIVYYDPLLDALAVDELLMPTIFHNGVRMDPSFSGVRRAAKWNWKSAGTCNTSVSTAHSAAVRWGCCCIRASASPALDDHLMEGEGTSHGDRKQHVPM